MECPACSNQLTQREVAGVVLDVCDNGCAGIWFDQFEFKKFDEKAEPDAETIMHLTKVTTPSTSGIFNCPKCLTFKMMRHFASVKRKVTMDECPNCAGVWLDAGELHSIRDEFASEDDRRHAAEGLFAEMFDAKLAMARRESKEKLARAQSFAQAFRFICPSYFIPGKHDGRAF